MHPDVIDHIGGGLQLRRATLADAERLVAFHADIHREPGSAEPAGWIAAWVQALMSGAHPTFSAGDFTIIEETDSREIVSSLCLIPQTWSYAGIPFGVGRIELVSTHPDYRRRGLVRRQMEVAHAWSAERGHLLQGITGIPFYYRRFGYEMALELGGGRSGYRPHIPDLPEDTSEPFQLRPATRSDLPFIVALDEQARTRWLVSAVRDEALWRYEIELPGDERYRWIFRVIERPDGAPVGYLVHAGELWGPRLSVSAYELADGVSWLAVTPSVLRYLRTTGTGYAKRPEAVPFEMFSFAVGADHPVYRAIPERLPRVSPPYAWYLRIADLPGFVRHIASVVERRLTASVASGHSAELLLGCYGEGLRLVIEDGRIVTVEPWSSDDPDAAGAAFPGLSLIQLVVGHRSLSELEYAYPDLRVNGEEARVLLDAIFPKLPSHVWAIE